MSNPTTEKQAESSAQTEQTVSSIQANGVELNGIRPNGIRPNGIKPNGIKPNGIRPNGIKPNGEQAEGTASPSVFNERVRIRALVLDGVLIESDAPEGLAIEAIVVNGVRYAAKDGGALQIDAIAIETEETDFDPSALSVTTVELPSGETFQAETKS